MSVAKLKESIQEVVVFLRSLGQFKIPAVIERRRKELLEHLLELQGEPSRGAAPRKLEEAADEKEKERLGKTEKAESLEKSEEQEKKQEPKSPTKRLEKRDSKVVLGLVGNFETIQKTAKDEEIAETPKRWVTLKKVAKPQDFPAEAAKKAGDEEEQNKDEQKEGAAPESKVEVKEPTPAPEEKEQPDNQGEVTLRQKDNGLKPERPSSAASIESHEILEEEDKGGKKKKKSKLNIFRGRKGKRDKSPAPSASSTAAERLSINGDEGEGEKSGGSEGEQETEEQPPTPPLEEGVKIVMTLERKTKATFGRDKWIKQEVKLKESTLCAGDKEIELAGFAVAAMDSGFELNHPYHKPLVFRVVEGGDEAKNKWVTALTETIEECTPPEEEKKAPEEVTENGKAPEAVPSITVEEPVPEEHATPSKKKKESKALKPLATQQRLPDHGVEMKGYVYRKRPGLGKSWDKTYCVLTYQAVYFTTMEDNKEYSHILNIPSDAQGSVTPKKGHDKSSQGLVLKVGKKSEHLSIESQPDFDQWKAALERVLGLGGVEELLSEDEEFDEVPPDVGGEELYEELELDVEPPPPVPQSPRPAHSRPPIPVPDDIIIDEDIYEDTDDYRFENEERLAYDESPPPSLPDRNQPKKDPSPPPNLPPRNAPTVPTPALPPRNSPQPAKKKAPANPPPPVAPPAAAEEEELYDDVVVPVEEIQEEYEDVIVPAGQDGIEEELYDDVVAPEPITEEFYEDMAPGTEPQEDYVVMEPGQDAVEQELYVDVEEPTTSIKSTQSPKSSVTPTRPKSSGTFSRMFGGASKSKQQLHSGTVSYKGPSKKSKFEEKWAVIEGNTLQIFKSSSDKRSQEKLVLSDFGLNSGSTETGAGQFAFRLSKGEKAHHFSVQTQELMQGWVDILKGLTKYASVATPQTTGDQQVFQASEDHIADTDEELTFKKGTFLKLISKECADVWLGQIGNDAQVFDGKKGKFPANKVVPAEDLYI